MVPKMEQACKTMFVQIKQTFEQGMRDLNTELLAARESAAISQATPFVSGLKQATSEVRQAATALMTDIPTKFPGVGQNCSSARACGYDSTVRDVKECSASENARADRAKA